MKDIADAMDMGRIAYMDREEAAGDAAWIKHPANPGVKLKHLVSGRDTEGALSCHLVKLGPGQVLPEHVHEAQWELHEVVGGRGTATFDDRELDYAPGSLAVIPKGVLHSITASEEGVTLLAKFFPALT